MGGCMDASCLDTCAPSRTRHLRGLDRDCRGNGASILILSLPPPGFSGSQGEGGCSHLERMMGGLEPSLPTPPQC